MSRPPGAADPALLEGLAAELARTGGARVAAAFGRPGRIRYKGAGPEGRPTNPVSEVDRAVERELRDRLRDARPGDAVLGEEEGASGPPDAPLVWAIDPVDGTTNFLHRYPLVAVSVACLAEGRPLAGAIWCASGHALRPGVYHARAGGPLRFDGEPLARTVAPGAERRALVGSRGGRGTGRIGDIRITGSAASECALVAAGCLAVSRLARLHVWDVAAGVLLVSASGGEVRVGEDGGGWRRFDGFDPPLATWRRPMLLGEPRAVAELAESG